MHPHQRFIGVVACQRVRHLLRGQAQRRQVKRDHCFHPRVVIRQNGNKQRRLVQPGDGCHLRQVLVMQRQPVGAGGIQRRVGARGFVLGNHFFAAAGVARQAITA